MFEKVSKNLIHNHRSPQFSGYGLLITTINFMICWMHCFNLWSRAYVLRHKYKLMNEARVHYEVS